MIKNMNTKQIIVVRHDLIKGPYAVRRGKMMAQVAHASVASLMKLFTYEKIKYLPGGIWEPDQEFYRVHTTFGHDTILEDWLLGKFTKIVVSVPGEKELLELRDTLQDDHEYDLCPWALITDCGLTEFNGVPTNTCLGIGPWISEKLDILTGNLPLL